MDINTLDPEEPIKFSRINADINCFDGPYRWLSNFAPVDVVLDGVTYPSVENAYQAAKTIDPEERKAFVNCKPGKAKRLGYKVTMRDYWDEIKVDVMSDLLWQKFKQEPYLSRLVLTYDALITEGNTWGDTFWGVCDGVGQNNLGELIMKIRTIQLNRASIPRNLSRHVLDEPKLQQQVLKEIVAVVGSVTTEHPRAPHLSYPLFTIGKLRSFVNLHSYIYYTLDDSLISDEVWQEKANQLAYLQTKYTSSINRDDDATFKDFDGSTGCHLVISAHLKDVAQKLIANRDILK